MLRNQVQLFKEEDVKLLSYDKCLSFESHFIILINNKVFFDDPYFCILEFWKDLSLWNKKSTFTYNAVETDENPLIQFILNSEGWLISSPWGLFNALGLPITTKELDSAIAGLKNQLFQESGLFSQPFLRR